MVKLETQSPAETKALGRKIARNLKSGDIIALIGELGAGKTCLAQGLALGLGVSPKDYVASPSFVLVKEYGGRTPLYHIDLFRINSTEELESLGWEEYLYGEGVCIIEWAERAGKLMPSEYLRIELEILGSRRRRIRLKAFGRHYQAVLRKLR
ncbi:tRNA (adenosine(37)-N6)-threonylcarbamoyltransferase complex ATPase subunit type 1 TsaE [bacterium]|nr:tRNA (adenosine(37)-N6)-threonylcarbamoyltransferase complex ATPase subunit type 1 TsaE [bacterium]MCK4436957.1 tRNA (adenosine(37)-N6)-threonylcarbamoyltransferase complex ATPase subunit type 1 TsaE [bacterium]